MSDSSGELVPSRARASELGTRLDSTVITHPKGDVGCLFSKNGKVIEITNLKVIVTGDCIEVLRFEKPIKVGVSYPKKRARRKKNSLRDQEYRDRKAHRANNTIRRLANGNFSKVAKFLTLTFNNDQHFDITNITQCNRRHALFIKKLQLLHPQLRYISVLEFQKRGAVHYHILNDLPFIDKQIVSELWSHGFIDIREVGDPVKIGGYICKYMAKNCADPRFSQHRSYFASKNLIRPEIHYGFNASSILEMLKDRQPVFANSYQAAFNGTVDFQEYNMNYISPSEEVKRST